jgi:hypothetical protein
MSRHLSCASLGSSPESESPSECLLGARRRGKTWPSEALRAGPTFAQRHGLALRPLVSLVVLVAVVLVLALLGAGAGGGGGDGDGGGGVVVAAVVMMVDAGT